MDAKFQSFWYGSNLSPIEYLCLLSFVNYGVDFELYTYDKDLAVPHGVALRNASEIYDRDKVFTYQDGPGKGSVAAFADMFRYKLLYERGGWWVDMDVLYTGHDLPKQQSFFGWENDSHICNAIMRVEEGSSVARECLARAEELGKDVTWGEAGPKLLTEVVRRHGEIDQVFSPGYAYPVSWQEAPCVYRPSEKEAVQSRIDVPQAPFLHLWNEGLRRVGIQKNIAPPVGSYLAFVAEKLGVEWRSQSVRYTDETIKRMWENYQTAQESNWRLKRIINSRSWKVLKFLRLDFSTSRQIA